MTTLRQALYGMALIATLALLIWLQQQRIESITSARATAEVRAEQAGRDSAGRQLVIDQLQAELQAERQTQAALRAQQQQIRQQLADRQHKIKELTHENQHLRDWAGTALPAAAQRLRARPTLTGAADYQAWLSRSDALHPAGDQPAAERRPAD